MDVFYEPDIKLWMDVTKKDREDVFVYMEKMLSDCDVSVVHELRYASRFRLSFENN